MRFKDKFFVVTGSASGIGAAVASRLSDEGAFVFGLDRAPGTATSKGITPLTCDVGDESEVRAAFQKISQATSGIHGLVNVAGVLTIGPKTPLCEQSLEQWESMLRTDLTSVLLMMKHMHPLLKNATTSSIVNVSSDQSLKGRRFSAPYGVSKAAINALSRIAALEFIADQIRVNVVAPGAVKTSILKPVDASDSVIDSIWKESAAKLPFGPSEPDDVTSVILFLLSDEARRITGEVILADSGQMLL